MPPQNPALGDQVITLQTACGTHIGLHWGDDKISPWAEILQFMKMFWWIQAFSLKMSNITYTFKLNYALAGGPLQTPRMLT